MGVNKKQFQKWASEHWVLIFLSAVYVVLYALLFEPGRVVYFGDSGDYEGVAKQPFFSRGFWGGVRAVGFPLLLKSMGMNHRILLCFQFFSTLAAWIFFSATVARFVKHRFVKVFGFFSLLAISLHKDFYFWVQAVLTEAISHSVFVVLLGLAFLLLSRFQEEKKPSPKRIFWIWPLVLYWAFTRDSHAYFILGTSGLGFLALALFWKKFDASRQKLLAIFSILGLLTFAMHEKSANLGGQRWMFPFLNVLGKRILVDSEKTKFFRDRGMPWNDKVQCFTNQYASGCGRDWSGFGDWIKGPAKGVYIQFLLSRPLEHMWIPLARWQDFFTSAPWGYAGIAGEPPVIQRAIGYLFVPKGMRFAGFVVLSITLAILAWAYRRWDWRFVIPVFLILLTYPMMFLVWHGDTMELPRHCLGLVLQAKIGFLLLAVFSADLLLTNRARRGARRA